MQQFVSNKQRQLSEFLQDAWEWNSAPAEAAKDRQSGWEVVCALSAKQCPFGADCGYAAAATRIFDANSDTLRKDHLATCLRDHLDWTFENNPNPFASWCNQHRKDDSCLAI